MKRIALKGITALISLSLLAGSGSALAEGTDRLSPPPEAETYAAMKAPVTDTAFEYELLRNIVEQIREKTDFEPQVGLILGSGLGSLVDKVDKTAVISYQDLPGLPVSTAPGHEGRFIFGYLSGVPVVIMQGRVHCYEGYSALQVVRPVRVMGMLGIKTLVLTNSSGAINQDLTCGEIMMITDHILYGVPNPLIGANLDELGERFTDMKDAYDPALQQLLRVAAREAGVSLTEGVYLQDTGPSYETCAETKLFRLLGADAVGMSTGIEAIAARHMGIQVCGLSCVTAAPSDISTEILSDEVVNSRADAMTENLGKIIALFLEKLEF